METRRRRADDEEPTSNPIPEKKNTCHKASANTPKSRNTPENGEHTPKQRLYHSRSSTTKKANPQPNPLPKPRKAHVTGSATEREMGSSRPPAPPEKKPAARLQQPSASKNHNRQRSREERGCNSLIASGSTKTKGSNSAVIHASMFNHNKPMKIANTAILIMCCNTGNSLKSANGLITQLLKRRCPHDVDSSHFSSTRFA